MKCQYFACGMGSVEMGLTVGAVKLNVATGGRANHAAALEIRQ